MPKRTLNLKQRIVAMFVGCMLLIFGGILVLSNYTIESILHNKIETGYQSTVKQIAIMLENTISNINHVSQQLAVGTPIDDLEQYLTATEGYEKIRYSNLVKDHMALLTFTNPNIGLSVYADSVTGEPLFYTGSVSRDFSVGDMPVLMDTGDIRYLGPAKSKGASSDRIIVAATRKIRLTDDREVFLYIESSFRLLEDILDTNQGDRQFPILFLDQNETITYSQAEEFAVGSSYHGTKQEDYYPFRETVNQGWSIVSMVPHDVYMAERNQWLGQLTIFCFIIVGFCILIAWMLWRTIYRPLNIFDRRISTVLDDQPVLAEDQTNIAEYDYLLGRFEEMKGQIREMIAQISEEEQRRADLEVEKLRYQINPHFLMNTLNTVHWMALMNNQDEIDHTVQALNRLLLYNLNKENKQATLAQEVTAVREYLTLQQVRYDFSFDSTVLPVGEELEYCCPKFILQPLVENALYHGYRQNMHVSLHIEVGERIMITVADDGIGMPVEALEKMRSLQSDKPSGGLGIGFNYVIQCIGRDYSGQAEWSVDSEEGKGTTVRLILPKEMKQEHVEGSDRR